MSYSLIKYTETFSSKSIVSQYDIINSIIFTSYATKTNTFQKDVSNPTSNPQIKNVIIPTEYQILKITVYFFLVLIIIIFYVKLNLDYLSTPK